MSAAWKVDVQQTRFRNEAKRASKRHRFFAKNLGELLERLEADPLNEGDRLQQVGSATPMVFKVRLGIPEERVSARAGYRLIFDVDPKERIVRMLSVYYKPDQADITAAELLRLMRE